MKMYEIDVSCDEDTIWLKQHDSLSEHSDIITITKEQAELVCKWIMELAKGGE